MKVLLDTNVILDYFLEREPFLEDAETIFDANDQGLIECYISGITPLNLAFVGRKYKDKKQLHQILISLLADFQGLSNN